MEALIFAARAIPVLVAAAFVIAGLVSSARGGA